jgi:hypothetical protein
MPGTEMKKHILYALLLTFAHLFLLSGIKFTAWPEMVLWPYLILEGYDPYKDIAIAHTPLLITALTLFNKLFGLGVIQLKVFTWLIIIATDLMVYFSALKLFGKKTAFPALVFYAFWQTFFDGNGLWFDLTLAPLTVIAFYLTQKKRYFALGVLWLVLFLGKQTAFWYLLPIFIHMFNDKENVIKNAKLFLAGTVLAALLFALTLASVGILKYFINWAIEYGIFVLPRSSGQIQLPSVKTLAVSLFPFSPLLLIILYAKKKAFLFLSWILAGIMGAYPRFEFFHFQPAVPLAAVFFGFLFTLKIKKNLILIKLLAGFYVFASVFLFAGFLIRNMNEGVRFYEDSVVKVIRYVKDNTEPSDEIFVLNWWDNIYAYSDRVPATTPWVPQLSWYQEIPGIQIEETEDIKRTKPELVIFYPYTSSGLSSYVPETLYGYIKNNYVLKERIDGIEILEPKNNEDSDIQ